MEEKVYEYLKRLVSVPGISDTDEERKTAEAIREILAEQPYFRAYPENFGTVEILGTRESVRWFTGWCAEIGNPDGRSF